MSADNDGAGSLRQAIADAAAAAGDDEIVFDAAFFNTPRTINLLNELNITSGGNLTIMGPGVDFLEVVNPVSMPMQPARYAVNVSNIQLTLRNLKLRGLVVSAGASAIIEQVRFLALGITNRGTVTINDSVIRNCGGIVGGGIYTSGTVFINRSTIAANSARNGGGIYADAGSVTINNSIISGNHVQSVVQSNGGGIHLSQSSLTINNSIVSDNTATGGGGGIHGAFGSLYMYNSTVTRNSASSNDAGGITAMGGRIINSTVVGNFGRADVSANSSCSFGNSIVGSNYGFFNSLGYNIIGNTTNTQIIGTTTGNQLNVNPQLAPLANNGGTSETLALLPTSPAINAGSDALAVDANGNLIRFDQRGSCFRRFVGNSVDIGAFEVQSSTNPNCTSAFDFDGDGKADVSVFRPSNGTWYLNQSTSGFTATQFGIGTDKLAPADYDGDGRTDIAVWRETTPTHAYFYILLSATNTFRPEQFGTTGDVPITGDWNADGRADLSVYRSGASGGAQSYFFYRPLGTPDENFSTIYWGASGDQPVAGDYDGDGKTDAAVFKPSNGVWYISRSSNNQLQAVQFGISSDKPVAADYDGDGKTDVAVYRNGTWYLQRSTQGFTGISFGFGTDLPVPADYDGDDKADVAVYRNGVWYLQRSQAGFTGVAFGVSNDLPTPNAFVR